MGNVLCKTQTSQPPLLRSVIKVSIVSRYRSLLTDLPIDMIDKIADFLGPIDRFALRKVSHSLCKYVDSKDPALKKIKIEISKVAVIVCLNEENTRITYEFVKNRCFVQNDNLIRIWEGRRFIELVFEGLFSAMKNNKLQTDLFRVRLLDVKPKEMKKWSTFIKAFFKPLEKLHSESVVVSGFDVNVACEILSHFKEGILNKIYFYPLMGSHTPQDTLTSMPQWKMAQLCDMTYYCIIPIEHFFHFSKLFIHIPREFTEDDAIKIRDVLMNSASFERCYIMFESVFLLSILRVFGSNNNHVIRSRSKIFYKAANYRYCIDISYCDIYIRWK